MIGKKLVFDTKVTRKWTGEMGPKVTAILTNFWLMLPFYTPWKHQKTKLFLVFSGGIKWEHWQNMGWNCSLKKLRLIMKKEKTTLFVQNVLSGTKRQNTG